MLHACKFHIYRRDACFNRQLDDVRLPELLHLTKTCYHIHIETDHLIFSPGDFQIESAYSFEALDTDLLKEQIGSIRTCI